MTTEPAPIVIVPGNPMPPGGAARWLVAPDGCRLRMVIWTAEAAGLSSCRGTVFLFGGRGEFAEKYFETAGDLLARGFSVATLDWRGQGLSGRLLANRRNGHIDDFSSFGRDLEFFMRETGAEMPEPHFALAHSMGGHILLRAVHDHPDWFRGLVLSAPMLGLRLGRPMARKAIRLFAAALRAAGYAGRYVPGGSARAADEIPFADNIVTHDEGRYAMQQALIRTEPDLGLGSTTVGWLDAAFRSLALISDPAYLGAVRTPVLIAMAAEDALIDPEALRRAAALLADAELVRIEGARHEILMEKDRCRGDFWAAFDAFIARVEGARSG